MRSFFGHLYSFPVSPLVQTLWVFCQFGKISKSSLWLLLPFYLACAIWIEEHEPCGLACTCFWNKSTTSLLSLKILLAVFGCCFLSSDFLSCFLFWLLYAISWSKLSWVYCLFGKFLSFFIKVLPLPLASSKPFLNWLLLLGSIYSLASLNQSIKTVASSTGLSGLNLLPRLGFL